MEEGTSNRHRYQSHASILKATHVPVLPSIEDTTVIPDASSSFYESLLSWRELNLTGSFTAFADEVDPLTKSMHLLLHNWEQVVDIWERALGTAETDSLEPFFDLTSKMTYDLRTTLSPAYTRLLTSVLALTSRKLSAPALQALLAALASLFKYLLVSSSSSRIQETWTKVAAVFHAGGEVARLVAEVWGRVLRRIKGVERDGLVSSMLEEKGVEFCVAVALVEGMKSPNHAHPPSAPSLLRFLLSHLAAHPQSQTLQLTFKRVLTALLHHTTPVHFAPLMEALLDSREVFVEMDVQAWIQVIRVPLAVRKGSRIQDTHIKRLLPILPTLPASPKLVHVSTSALIASNLSIWASEGKRMLTALWALDDKNIALELCQSLLEAEWKGWKTFGLPLLIQHQTALLGEYPGQALRVLSEMAGKGSLQDLPGMTGGRGFLDTLSTWVSEQIAVNENFTEDELFTLSNILPLVPHLPSPPDLGPLIHKLVASENVELEWQETPANRSWALAACLECVVESGNADTVAPLIPTIVETWVWNVQVMAAVANIVTALKKPLLPRLNKSILQPLLLSESAAMRTAGLRILCSNSVETMIEETATYKQCLAAEEVPLSVDKIRERILKTERVGGIAGVDWLVAQLKINLRPLWQPTSQTIAKIIQQHPEEAWNRLYAQLEGVSLRPEELVAREPRWTTSPEETGDVEDERTFRDPSLAKMDRLVEKVLRSGSKREYDALAQSQRENNRLDIANFEGQLLKTLALVPSTAEKHNRPLVTLLLHFVGEGNQDAELSSTRAIPRRFRSRVGHWLSLFSKFSNPRAVYQASKLQQLYMACLCTPERSIQRVAVDCLLTDATSPLKSHDTKLILLLDDTKFRDELSSLNVGDLPDDVRAGLVPVLVRLLYGVMISRSSKTRARRRAILSSLTSCTTDELATLVQLMLDPFQGLYNATTPEDFRFSGKEITANGTQQVGYLRLLGDVMTYLAPSLQPMWPALLTTTLELLQTAQKEISTAQEREQTGSEADDADSDADSRASGNEDPKSSRYAVRQLGFKRLSDFCRRCPALDLSPYLPDMFLSFISPRVTTLVAENSQAPSSLLELFHTWSEQQATCFFLVRYDDRIIPSLADLLTAVNVKPAVVSRILDVFDHLLDHAVSDASVMTEILAPNAEHLLTRLSDAVSAHGTKIVSDILKREMALLSRLAPQLTNTVHAERLLTVLKPLFRRTGKAMPEKIISDLLQVYASLFRLANELRDPFSAFYVEMYELLGQLFQSLRERQSRLSLVSAFYQLVSPHPEYALIGELASSLNAFAVKRPEEADFDRRLAAFSAVNENHYLIMGHLQWIPILHNALFFIQDPDELSIRSNASFVLRRFIERLHDQPIPEFEQVFIRVIYPGLRRALHSKIELVRREVLDVLATATEKCDFTLTLREMRPLLADGDEEASVFSNFYHTQTHRRTRALRRLAEQVRNGGLGSTVLSDIFIPLIDQYILDGSVDHQIVHEAIQTMGAIATRLSWRAYYGLVQRYLRLGRRKTASERLFVRTVIIILEHFSFSLDAPAPIEPDIDSEDMEEQEPDPHAEEEARPTMDESTPNGPVRDEQALLVQQQRILDVVKSRLLPTLLSYMDDKTATDDAIRIPIAYGVICIALKLPDADRSAEVGRLLTVLSQVLRSRSHDTRQLARETLFKIAVLLGPEHFPRIVQALREALLRGPQLHVLSVTVHGLLLHVTQPEHLPRFSSMDQSASSIAHIASEVIFGQSGKDVRNEGFRTTFKEVRSSATKGLDTFQLVSRLVSVAHVRDLLSPLRQILQTTDSPKALHLVNDVLHRIASGLNSNTHLSPEDVLSLCHTLISQRSKLAEEQSPTAVNNNGVGADFAVQMKRKAAEAPTLHSGNLQKFIAFGLDLFITAFRRNRFNLKDEGILARLEPLVPLIGEALYTDDSQVAMTSIKASAAILRCPLRTVDKSLTVFIKRLLNLIRKAGSLDAEMAQAALKSLAIILRDCGKAKIVEADLKYLLEMIGPELEEPDRQSTAFTLLRSIIARQFVAPEIYDLMDRVFDVMVTNQSAQVREACRGIALQFLLDYPQGKGRLRKHMAFMATNLSYEFESGRFSLMELLGAVLDKFQPDLLREYVDMLFASLVMDLANDDSTRCKEMGAELVKKLWSRLDQQQQEVILVRLHLWIKETEQTELCAVSAQVYGLLLEHPTPALQSASPTILQDLAEVIVRCDKEFQLAEQEDEAGMNIDIDWRAPYYALTALLKLCHLVPSLSLSKTIPLGHIMSLFLFPHAWVRLASARLTHVVVSSSSITDAQDWTAYTQEHLPLLLEVARLSTLQLRSPNLDADLSLQIVKNLMFVSKCFAAISVPVRSLPEEVDDQSSDVEENDEPEKDASENPLAWLFSRLSFQLRRAHSDRRKSSSISNSMDAGKWAQQPLAILRWFAAMASHLEVDVLQKYLPHILSPVYRLLDDDTTTDKDMEELKALCREVQDMLQQKAGTTAFSSVYNQIRQRVTEVRRERKTARVVQVAANPEAAARYRMKRNQMKVQNRKRKAGAYAESRGRVSGGKRRRVD